MDGSIFMGHQTVRQPVSHPAVVLFAKASPPPFFKVPAIIKVFKS